MTDVHLFTEVFPVSESAIPRLAAFIIAGVDEGKAAALGEELAARLQQGFGGQWAWLDGRILTDSPPTEVEMMIALDIIRGEQSRRYGRVEALHEDPTWQPTPKNLADFVVLTGLRAVEADMRLALGRADALGDFQLQTWVVDGRPAVSLSVTSRDESASDLKPSQRAQRVKIVSDIAKNAGVLTSAYNSRDLPEVFLQPSFEANLMFDGKRVRPYKLETLGEDFGACGVYRRRVEFESGPIRIAAINTLPVKIDDFVEAMKRQLERRFGFSIQMIRERKVKVLSRSNVQSAVKVVEEEDAHIVLVFVPDEFKSHDVDAEYVKSLVVRKGIASQLIDAATVDDPEAMNTVILGLLGKTGNAPFVLAEPMPYAHFVIGLDLVRERRKDAHFVTAIARIYRSDGAFVRYAIREVALEAESRYVVLMRDLLPQKEFGGKRAIIHYGGVMPTAERDALMGWAQAIGAAFYPVEIIPHDTPYLYALEGGRIVQPPWGSAFRLSDTEAFLATAVGESEMGPPLYVRTTLPLTIEEALHSALVWTLLHYGAFAPRRLPVTVQFGDVIGQWLAKGALPEAKDGTVPFWL